MAPEHRDDDKWSHMDLCVLCGNLGLQKFEGSDVHLYFFQCEQRPFTREMKEKWEWKKAEYRKAPTETHTAEVLCLDPFNAHDDRAVIHVREGTCCNSVQQTILGSLLPSGPNVRVWYLDDIRQREQAGEGVPHRWSLLPPKSGGGEP